MEEIKIKKFDDIPKIIERYRHPFTQLQFRGQLCKNCNWTLKPSISRKISTAKEMVETEQFYLTEFKKRLEENNLAYRIMEKENPREFQNDWEWLTQAQHYGLPTRLMDWSLDWNTGLYFAVNDPIMDSKDGQLYIYCCPNGIIYGDSGEEGYNDFYALDPFNIKESIIINPSYFYYENHKDYIGHERRWKQMGRFLIQNNEGSVIAMENNPEFAHDLISLIIPSDIKAAIRTKYHENGFTNDYLYGEKDPLIESIIGNLKRFKEIPG